MNTRKFTHWTVGLVATAALATSLVTAATEGGGNAITVIATIRARIAALGITADQREQIRGVLREFQPTVQPLVQKCIQDRRALRAMIQAPTVDEAAIRAQSAKVAATEADLAVARARIVEKARPVLTSEQLQGIHRLEEDAYSRIDAGLGRLAHWIEGK